MSSFDIHSFFDEITNTVTYVVSDIATKHCAVIDPVLDFSAPSGNISHHNADRVIEYLDQHNLELKWILETHAHADHLSASQYIKQHRGGQIGIGEHIQEVQRVFKGIYNFGDEVASDGSQFDHLFAEGDRIVLGETNISVMHTPGHTPACVCYCVGDAIFVGDTLFMPDFGTARTDFPSGSAEQLFQSIQKILALPDETRVFVGHDYKAPNRDVYQWQTTVGEQKHQNVHVKLGTTEQEFVEFRNTRDAGLDVPKLLLPSIQVNIQAGHLPEPESNQTHYLKIPLQIKAGRYD
ncbi:MAG: MBL fold metallo-hydrolase [Gammaproteobacteria bacterium]|nr:MBL fold metallo-hydrolase [Gammaproteobacteria bacterium]